MKRILLTLAAALICVSCVGAKSKAKAPAKKSAATAAAKAPAQSPHRRNPYVGAVSMDAKSGSIVKSENPDAPAYPASVTKLMTALLVLEDVKAGKYKLSDMVTATDAVYRSEPSWVGIKVGEQMSVEDLLAALLVESANDAAIALAVHSAGGLMEFVAKMNARAAALGMKGTTYYNPNGLPPKPKYPWKKFNVSTAADQAKLGLELVRKHPEILKYTSIKTCDLVRTPTGFRVSVTRRTNGGAPAETVLAPGEKIEKALRNHNNVMRTDKLKILNPDGTEAVDGLKTGYIDAGGSSVVLTGSRGKTRVIVVVLGSASAKLRDANAAKMMGDALGALAW